MIGQKFRLDPGWGILKEFWLKFLERRLGESEGFLFRKHESKALGEMDGDVVRRSKRGCPSGKRMGPGLVNVLNGF